MDTGSAAAGCGAYDQYVTAGFFGPSGSFSVNHLGSTVTYTWKVAWSAAVSTSLCFVGASYAAGSIILYGNVYDQTTSSWVLNGPASTTVWSQTFACGLSWAGYQAATYWTVSFTGNFYAGNVYYLETYMTSYTEAGAVGLAAATAANNIATGGNGAIVTNMYIQ
jgi:hypothetical protein